MNSDLSTSIIIYGASGDLTQRKLIPSLFNQCRKGRLPKFAGGPGAALWRSLAPLRNRVWPADTAGKRLAVGMLWGWMPCGLSTTLLAAAWLQASAMHGALTMAAFGIGTRVNRSACRIRSVRAPRSPRSARSSAKHQRGKMAGTPTPPA